MNTPLFHSGDSNAYSAPAAELITTGEAGAVALSAIRSDEILSALPYVKEMETRADSCAKVCNLHSRSHSPPHC